MTERLWTVSEAAERLGVSRSTVHTWCATGRLTAIRRVVGDRGHYRIPDRALRVLVGLDPPPMPTLEDLFTDPSKPSSDD
jgi:excisionase family DNA binding protein